MFSSDQQDASQIRSLINANETRKYFLTIYMERLPSYLVTEPMHSYFRSESERVEMVHKILTRIPEVCLSCILIAPNAKWQRLSNRMQLQLEIRDYSFWIDFYLQADITT
jgi:hypothetical protein